MRARTATGAGTRLRRELLAVERGLVERYPGLWPRHRLELLESGSSLVLAGWEVADHVAGAQSEQWFRLEVDDRVIEVKKNPDCRDQRRPGCQFDHEHWQPI